MPCTAMLAVFVALLVRGLSFRIRRKAQADSCSSIGCGTRYDQSRDCQCNDECRQYGNCCSDYGSLCEGSGSCSGRCGSGLNSSAPCQCNSGCTQYGDCCPDYAGLCQGSPIPPPGPAPSPSPNPSPGPSPSPGMNATVYWQGVDMNSTSAIQSRLRDGPVRLSYTPGLWDFYKEAWVNLPGGCQSGLNDVYSAKCWTPGSDQCGNCAREGECYNREHSWPKSWWGGDQNFAYSDVFFVFPSDGFVNGRRGSYPLGEVSRPSYTSSEGNKVGPCVTPGYSGTCFEPTDRVKGLLARGNLYVSVRYMNEFSCCSKEAVNGANLEPWTANLLLQWHAAHPPQPWEVEFNNRGQQWQGNRNPFIDYPQTAQELFR